MCFEFVERRNCNFLKMSLKGWKSEVVAHKVQFAWVFLKWTILYSIFRLQNLTFFWWKLIFRDDYRKWCVAENVLLNWLKCFYHFNKARNYVKSEVKSRLVKDKSRTVFLKFCPGQNILSRTKDTVKNSVFDVRDKSRSRSWEKIQEFWEYRKFWKIFGESNFQVFVLFWHFFQKFSHFLKTNLSTQCAYFYCVFDALCNYGFSKLV